MYSIAHKKRFTHATKTGKAIVLLATLSSFSSFSFAADINVPGEYSTIQQAINASITGDVIHVAPGVYNENINYSGKDVTLRSTAGAASTTLQGVSGTVVQMGPAGVFEGFTVTNGQASFGAGLSVRGIGSVISKNIFDANIQSAGGYGAAIGGNFSSPIIDGNIFSNNQCDGQFLSGVVSFVNSSSPQITNNIFQNNPCRGINMTIPSSGSPLVANNTFVGNTVAIRVDRRITSSNQTYRNNILVNNEIGFEVDFGTDDYNPVWENNLVYGNGVDYDIVTDLTGTAGNISVDPLFADQDLGDFHLQKNSPAIDTGSNVDAPQSDFDGNIRPIDGDNDGIATVDMGAFEADGTFVNGDVNGLNHVRVRCYNRTTRERVDFQLPAGSKSWDCVANGLSVSSGDKVIIRIYGYKD